SSSTSSAGSRAATRSRAGSSRRSTASTCRSTRSSSGWTARTRRRGARSSRTPGSRTSTRRRRCSTERSARWSWRRDGRLERARGCVPDEPHPLARRGSRPRRRVVRARAGRDRARRRHRRRPRRATAARGRRDRRHGRPGAGLAGGLDRACRGPAVRRRELRRGRLPGRRPPLPRRARGGQGDGARREAPRRDLRQHVRQRDLRGGRPHARPEPRAQLLRARVAQLLRAGRPRGRRRALHAASSRDPAVARPDADTARRAAARAGAAGRPDQGRLDGPADARHQGRQALMAIIVDSDTRLVVQGLTGSEGRFHGLRNRAYGTNVVAGVTPGKGGQDVDGIPVFDTVADAVAKAGANTTLIFVPARFAADAIYEAVDAGIQTVICITEHVPVHEMLRAYTYFRPKGITMIGPNCPGVLSPGKANVGIIPAEIFSEGAVGLVSRSGTLTYQIGHELTQLGLGNSTIVGIGGDPIVGSSFIDVLAKFEADPETEYVVLVGEIGGDEEEK